MNDGWKSRKLWTAVFAMGLIMAGFTMCKDRNGAFLTFTSSILTAAGLFKAASLIEKIKLPGTPAPPAP